MGVQRKLLGALALLIIYTMSGFASPLGSKLLWLVPSGAGIVSGFENYPDPHRHGQMLLSTHNNRVDLADWLAISGVDSKRSLDEGIEVASASEPGGLLTEHLLLVVGQFDTDRIYKSAELNGAQRNECESQNIEIIQPFTREKEEMQDVRWLVILDNRIGMLGTPALVKQALVRYQTRADVDTDLAQKLSQLPHDVSSWNLLVSPATERRNIYMHEGSRWAGLVEEADVLMVGARFGPKVRVDFLLHTNKRRETEFFKQKAASFKQLFASVLQGKSEERRAPKLSVQRDRVGGSIELSQHEFQIWGEQGKPVDAPAGHPISHGE
jgi:hypothetical protein